MTDREALELLLKTYVEMNRMASCEPGEKSHALWHSTDFIKREIKLVLKRLSGKEDLKALVREAMETKK